MQFVTLIDANGLTTSVQSISRSVGQKVCFFGRLVGDFEASDDDSIISTVDP